MVRVETLALGTIGHLMLAAGRATTITTVVLATAIVVVIIAVTITFIVRLGAHAQTYNVLWVYTLAFRAVSELELVGIFHTAITMIPIAATIVVGVVATAIAVEC